MPEPDLEALPSVLQPLVAAHWAAFETEDVKPLEAALAATAGAENRCEFAREWARVWALSDYAAEQCRRHPQWLAAMVSERHQALDGAGHREALEEALQGVEDQAGLESGLRLYRHRQMLRIIWRDLSGRASLAETLADLSGLAESCIAGALNWLHDRLCAELGTPYAREKAHARDKAGTPQRMLVLGMGKLGAGELNLSSDIDLIFAFPEGGETQGGRRCVDNQTFFNRLGQQLIQALDTMTADGFVFRVDMRLRPYGKSGILCPSFAAMEEYYQHQGREWERYALIKARVIAGDQNEGERLMTALKPFVYRKYLDFSAFDSLREMKRMINREVRRRQLENNVKLGPGGIREIEFIAQAFQLIRGGQDARLQQPELGRILPLLPEVVGMPEEAVDELLAAYEFLRRTEHALQAVADQQTQDLPQDNLGRARLALALDQPDWDSFAARLRVHRHSVHHHFAEVIAIPEEESEDAREDADDWWPLWQGKLSEEEAQDQLAAAGHEDSARALKLLEDLRNSRRVGGLQPVARERLDRVMPALLAAVAGTEAPSRTLERCLQLIEAVLRRSAYLVLLVENPGALVQLVRLCSASPWFAHQLARQPVLLDELLDPASLYHPPDRESLADELRQQLLRVPEDDEEQQMNALRYFKNAHVLRVAAAEVSEVLPLMKVSDYLTSIAEVVLEGALAMAWRLLVARHGRPLGTRGQPSEGDFIIAGYGKLGGIELSYGSDLDLVFIHDGAEGGATEGPKCVDNQVFFTRLGQKIIHILNTATTSGQLYEVDMRLRPSGNSGLLVSSLQAFRKYQLKDAWTWEHQALVRARAVAGSERLQQAFEALRKEVLKQPREPETLRAEVRQMRERMRAHLGSAKADSFDLKQDAGGLVDIEFMAQYLVLAQSHRHPDLLSYSDNMRLLEASEAAGLLAESDARQLREVYKTYRAWVHRRALQEQPARLDPEALAEERAAVVAIWRQLMEDG